MMDLDQLKKDDYKWFSQHDGYVERKDFDWMMKEHDSISFAHLRLWQLSLVNEISELTRSTTILPISLQNINNLSYNETPFHMQRISEIGTHLHKIIKTVSTVESDSYRGSIENCPPLFSLLVDKSHSNEHVIEVLFQIRQDFSELRFKANEFESLIRASNSLRDKKDIINEWNISWGLILKGDFRKPQLIKKLVSSETIAKIIATPGTAGKTSLLKALLDHINERKAYNRFNVYGELYNELEGVKGSKEKLSDKFSVDLMNIIKN